MKTNLRRYNGISILFSIAALLFFPLISGAQVKVLSGGSVGMGTTSPSSTIQAAPNRVLDLHGTGLTSYVLHGGSSGQETCLASNGIGTYFDIAGHSTASNNFFSFRTSNTGGSFTVGEKMRITSEGNVGIGTTSPDINASGSAYKTLSILGPNTSVNSCGILEMATQSTDADANIAGVLNFAASSNASTKRSIAQIVSFTQGTTAANRGGFMIFNTKPDGSTSTLERMRINNVGNVGIGTTTPNVKLDVFGISAFASAGSPNALGYVQLGTYVDGLGQIAVKHNGSINSADGLDITKWGGTQLARFATTKCFIMGGNLGIGTTTPGAYKVDVVGNLNVNGTYYQNGGVFTSDQQFKTNVDSISDALSIINQLKPRAYFFDTTNVYGMNFSNQKQYGLIAQDVEQLLPELIANTTKPATYDTAGVLLTPALTYKVLNYNAFTAIMLQGIKEQSSKIDSLSEGLLAEKTKANTQDSIINSLQNQMNQSITNNTLLQNQLNALASAIHACCRDNHDNGNHNGHREANSNQANVELNDAQTILLEQNVPNPFAEQTAINYSLPENTVKAQMLFYNAQGKLIQSTELTQKGRGTLNVFASDLSSGIYTYTLVVDGKIIETKKMVKQ